MAGDPSEAVLKATDAAEVEDGRAVPFVTGRFYFFEKGFLKRGPGMSGFGMAARETGFSVFFRQNPAANVRRSNICPSFQLRFKLSD